MDLSILKKKQFWFGVITVIAVPLFPAVQAFVSANPALVASVWGSIAALLHLAD